MNNGDVPRVSKLEVLRSERKQSWTIYQVQFETTAVAGS